MEPEKLPDRAQDRALTHQSLLIIGIFASTVIVLVLIWYLIDVLLLIFAAVLLAILLRTPADWLAARTRLTPGWALALVIVGLVALLGAAGWLFGSSVAEQTAQLTRQIPEAIDDVRERFEKYEWITRQIRPQELLKESAEFLGQGVRILSTTVGAIAGFFLVIIIGVFFAIQPDLYIRGFLQLVPPRKRKRAEDVLIAVGRILRWWLLGQLILMVAVGVMTGVGLWLLDVPLALVLGILAGLLTFIPYIGPILSAIPAVLVALSESGLLAGYVVLLYAAVQAIEGNLLEPIVQQKAVYLPPALVLLAQIVLGVLVGALGVMLATPLAAALMVAVKMLYVEDVLGAKQKAAA